MRTAGIIMECNPFHSGHRCVIEIARKIVDGGPVIVVMSGNFAQRGIPAVVSWKERARCVLEAGADIVLELPVVSALSGAEGFARGAIRLLIQTGLVTDLVFGSESADANRMIRDAEFLLREPEEFRILLKEKAASGFSYPRARAAAAAECSERICLPSSPNDLLGTEYCKALLAQNCLAGQERIEPLPESGRQAADPRALPSPDASGSILITPHAIPRIPSPSASSLRLQMQESGEGIFPDDFSGLLLEKLLILTRGSSGCACTDYLGVSLDLGNRIRRLLPRFVSWTQFCDLLKTRDITYTAVSRALMHILLDITSEFTEPAEPAYARLLGCRRAALPLLGELQAKGLVLVTGKADAARLPGGSSAAKSLRLDIQAAETWELVRRMTRNNKTGEETDSSPVSEYSRPLLILP